VAGSGGGGSGGGGRVTGGSGSDGESRRPRRYAANKQKKSLLRRVFRLKVMLLTALGLGMLGVGAVAIAYAMTPVPDANDFRQPETSIIYWNDGETELGRFSADSAQRESVTRLGDGSGCSEGDNCVPLHVQQAVLAAEDRSFYEHGGFDPVGIGRAVVNQLRGDAGGGSTITQQYVKNYFLTNEQTLTRKAKELFISVKLEQQLDKDTILLDYLNTIWWGRGTIHGVQTAAQSYFSKDVKDLTVEEGAVLAALIQNPDRLDPTVEENDPQQFEDRFRFVVNGMVEIGAIDQATADSLEVPEIVPRSKDNQFKGPNGHLIQQVKTELLDAGLDEKQIVAGGLRIVTTFDQKAQQAAVDAVEQEFPTDSDGNPIEDLHAGLTAVEPKTGAVVAMYGGPDYLERQLNNALVELQAGSSVKPFGLVRALEDGISLESRYHGDSPLEVEAIGDPVNNQGDYSWGGDVDLLSATKLSLNTAFVDLSYQLGYERVEQAMIEAGVPEDSPGLLAGDQSPGGAAGARNIIGIWGVTLVDLANSYATLAAEGERADWYTVKRATAPTGEEVYTGEANSRQVFDRDAVADTTYALSEVVHGDPVRDGNGRMRNPTGQAALELERPAAGKTGTHNKVTATFAGYTPQLAAVVRYYAGNGTESPEDTLDGKDPTSTSGTFPSGGVPARTWTAFMKAALDGEPVLPFPEPAEVGEAVNPTPTPTPEPTCEPGFEGTPPDCVEIEPTETPTPKHCPRGTELIDGECVVIVTEEPTPTEDSEVDVPSVIGMTLGDAKAELATVGLEADPQPRDAQDDWVVVDQRPGPGASVSPGSSVRLVTVVPEPPDPCEQDPPDPDCEDPPGGGGGGG
jgi:membrane peptidoglycan carboxypeptidase